MTTLTSRFALCLGLLASALAGCDAREVVLTQVVGMQESYFSPPGSEGSELEKLSDRFYTFRWGWYRNLVVDTDEGLVVTDPFTSTAAADLKKHLQETLPGRAVHTLIYTHYHLDHARGGAALEPAHAIAHEKCPLYWKDLGASDILAPTQLISGNQTLTIGGVEIRLIYLGKSHTDTLYALYFPQAKLLHTADFGLVRTIPPLGVPDHYTPGLIAGMERLARLDFETFVPSHFGYGTKQDFLDSLEFMRTLRGLIGDWNEAHGVAERGLPRDAQQLKDFFRAVYRPLRERYGDWHGFDEMGLFTIFRHTTGELLGY
jgi:glyoxylase-like metal-dependent hydrolase (beta-lactamase superfamily II)